MSRRTPNRLIDEKSPYLLQHAHNPVEWFPWGEEAFELARARNKPVFVSIGYAACHWCHVMERECFEDEEVARAMNQAFVCVKVDREERPDIDTIYMTACTVLSGRGGWPLNVILTPDKEPFFAATYLPKHSVYGRMGMLELASAIETVWATRRQDVIASAAEVTQRLQDGRPGPGKKDFSPSHLEKAATYYRKVFDNTYMGFGTAPKFPVACTLLFLMRHAQSTKDADLLDMVLSTLIAMRRGGMWDHVGFGFHRYSTDEKWLLPHFEKMLYDQATLSLAFLEAFQLTGNTDFARTAADIFTYVLRDMSSEEGGFFSAEDADSEGEEGKFYVWTEQDLRDVLGAEPDMLRAVLSLMNVRPEGNFHDEASGHLTGANILHQTEPLSHHAARLGLQPDVLRALWNAARERLFAARKNRIRPLLDDKILTDWNGLMIAALARGARVLGRPDLQDAALRAWTCIQTRLVSPQGDLLHRFRERADIPAMADDYAFLSYGLLELYRSCSDPSLLAAALDLQRRMRKAFWDEQAGGYFMTAVDGEPLPMRPKDIFEGALPTANSVQMHVLPLLYHLTGDPEWNDLAGKHARAFHSALGKQPSAAPFFFAGVAALFDAPPNVVLAGEPDLPQIKAMRAELDKTFLPMLTLHHKQADNGKVLAALAPFTESMRVEQENALGYFCREGVCMPPVRSVEEMRDLLADSRITADLSGPESASGSET